MRTTCALEASTNSCMSGCAQSQTKLLMITQNTATLANAQRTPEAIRADFCAP